MVPTRPGRMIKEMFTSRSVIVQALFIVLLLGNKLTVGSPVCHPECIGGCQGPSNSECVACKTYSLGDACVESCPDSHYISNITDDGITIGDDIGDEYRSVDDKEVSHTAAKPMIDQIPPESSPAPKTVASGQQNGSIEENFIQPQGSLHGRVNEQTTPNNMTGPHSPRRGSDKSNFTSDDAENNKTLANNRSGTEILTSNSYILSSERTSGSGNYEQHSSSSAAPVTVLAPVNNSASPTPTNPAKPLQPTGVCLPCHDACRRECSGPLSTDCVECKVKTDDGTCVSECSAGSYEDHNGREVVCHRCHDECRGGCHGAGPSNCTSCKHFKEFIDGQVFRCVSLCSGGSRIERLGKNFEESVCISEWGNDKQHGHAKKFIITLLLAGIITITIVGLFIAWLCIALSRTKTIKLENSTDSLSLAVRGEDNLEIVSFGVRNQSVLAIGNNTGQKIPSQANASTMTGGATCPHPSDQGSKRKSENVAPASITSVGKINWSLFNNFSDLEAFFSRRVKTGGNGSVSVRSAGSECDSGIGSLPASEEGSSLTMARADEQLGDSGFVPRMPCKHNSETSVLETMFTTNKQSLKQLVGIFDNRRRKRLFKLTPGGPINCISSKAVVMESGTRTQKVEQLTLLRAGETTTDSEDNPMKQKEDKVSTVQKIKGLLDKFNQIKATSNVSSNQQFSTKTFVVGVIGVNGGNLKLAEMGVNLYIPSGALDEDQTVYLYVEDSNYGNIKLNKGETVVTPTVYCGPPGRKFNKEVILSMPHCLEGDVSIDLSFVTYRTQSDGDPSAEWERVPPEQTLNIVKNGRFSIFIDHFTGHKGAATSSTDAPDQAIKKIITVLFAKSLKEGDIDFPFLVRMCSDLPSDIESIVAAEGDIGNKMLDKQPLIICDNEEGVTLRVDGIEQGWTLKENPEKFIHHDYFWGTASGIPHVPSHTFVLDRIPDHPQSEAERRRLVRCMLHVYQSSSPTRGVQIFVRSVLEEIPDRNMVGQGHRIPHQPRENPSLLSCRPKIRRPVKAAVAYKPESSQRETPSEKFLAKQEELHQTKTVLLHLPDKIARQLCTMLDVQANGLPAPDWCTFAEALELDQRVIDYLTQRQRSGESPTTKLLDFFFSEKCASETSPKLEDSLPELISIFRRIGHDQARMLIEAI